MSTTNKDAFNLYCTNLRDRYVNTNLHGCIHQEAGDVFLFFVNWVEWPFKFKGLMVCLLFYYYFGSKLPNTISILDSKHSDLYHTKDNISQK